ncbi:pyridoxamine 5'-phosphate oxidase family protein [Microlunatus aurantiacus]|uniref:Pyridoxamine 5'-phosphate oxidase family protein n=1 Tax=Microlunatus aurantiacus TaxID=446786 RepID=A0ABP7D4L7_9ACTN
MDFTPLTADFLRFTTEITYCTVTTVDPAGRPRSRVLHPIFRVVDGQPEGWAVTDRTPVKTAHLATNPYVACFYWSPAQNTVAIDCTAGWVEDDETRQRVWDLFAAPEPPGWGDMSGYGDDGLHHPRFHVLRLEPYRVQILRAEQLASGDLTPRTWRR